MGASLTCVRLDSSAPLDPSTPYLVTMMIPDSTVLSDLALRYSCLQDITRCLRLDRRGRLFVNSCVKREATVSRGSRPDVAQERMEIGQD